MLLYLTKDERPLLLVRDAWWTEDIVYRQAYWEKRGNGRRSWSKRITAENETEGERECWASGRETELLFKWMRTRVQPALPGDHASVDPQALGGKKKFWEAHTSHEVWSWDKYVAWNIYAHRTAKIFLSKPSRSFIYTYPLSLPPFNRSRGDDFQK